MTILLLINGDIAPSSLSGCLSNGILIIEKFTAYRRHQVNKEDDDTEILLRIRFNRKCKRSIIREVKRHRSVKKHKIMIGNSDGTLHEITSKNTLGYLLYIATTPRNNRLVKLFRSRFRLTHSSFISLHSDLKEDEAFKRYYVPDAAGPPNPPPSDTRLLLLGALRYLGRGFIYDNLKEAACISRETHRFFRIFIHYGSTVLY